MFSMRLQNKHHVSKYDSLNENQLDCSWVAFLSISEANFTKTCDDDDDDESCQCTDYLSFSEPPYDDNSPEKKWCKRAPFEFRSISRVLVINYVYQFGHDNSFKLSYSSESRFDRNVGHLQPINNYVFLPFRKCDDLSRIHF